MHSHLFSSSFSFQVVASKKVQHKKPFSPSGDVKWRKGVDVSGKTPKGKRVYQFVKKYGANIDGYSPIYAPNEWSETGDSYAGGVPRLAIKVTFLEVYF
jgi:photosystem II protein